MSLNLVTTIFAFLTALSGVVMIFACPFFGFVVARHFDPYFPHFVKTKDKVETGFWILNPMLRGMRYAGCLLFKNATKKRPYYRYFFNGFDFRAHARTSDWVVLWVVLGSNAMVGIFGIIMFIVNGFHLPAVSQ